MNKTLKPYLINAFYSWCMDTGKTPMIVTQYTSRNSIPSHLQDREYILLNIHPSAVRNLVFSKNNIDFEAQFNEEPFHLNICYASISNIYCKEDEEGLEFPIDEDELKNKPLLRVIK